MQRYTDLIGDETVIEHCTYQKQDSAYVLSRDGVQSIYRILERSTKFSHQPIEAFAINTADC